jgi:hypothetical protein
MFFFTTNDYALKTLLIMLSCNNNKVEIPVNLIIHIIDLRSVNSNYTTPCICIFLRK